LLQRPLGFREGPSNSPLPTNDLSTHIVIAFLTENLLLLSCILSAELFSLQTYAKLPSHCHNRLVCNHVLRSGLSMSIMRCCSGLDALRVSAALLRFAPKWELVDMTRLSILLVYVHRCCVAPLSRSCLPAEKLSLPLLADPYLEAANTCLQESRLNLIGVDTHLTFLGRSQEC
jgi:hypothetical protein